jgi:hypothetical protein
MIVGANQPCLALAGFGAITIFFIFNLFKSVMARSGIARQYLIIFTRRGHTSSFLPKV